MRQALAIRHVAFENLGNLADALHQNDFEVAYTEAGLDDLGRIDALEPEVLIVLGGPIGAYEEDIYPFLLDELRLLERRLAADLPTIGICLGAQLMARALGAKVYPGPAKELGWAPLRLTEEGWHSPMQHLAADRTAVLHWHGDTFDVPQGAVHLAATPVYVNQAFAWGKRGLALQFHPEVTARDIERWLIGHACEIGTTPGVSVHQLRQDTRRYNADLQGQAMKFWQTWLDAALMPHPVDAYYRFSQKDSWNCGTIVNAQSACKYGSYRDN